MSDNERSTKEGPAKESAVALSEREENDVRDVMPHRSPVLFEIIRRSGQEELERPLMSLWWSGIVAGLSIGFSVLTPALLRTYLPSGPWSELISQLGYCVGFVIVILSRQQLFTENVITAVIPVMASSHARNFVLMLRLWSIVLAANLVGTLLFATFLRYGGAIDSDLAKAVHDVSARLFESSPSRMIGGGVVSGFLIASLVWILAGIEGSGLAIIMLMTYVIALGHFDHVVAGSVEASYLVLDGSQTVGNALVHFFFPTLLGNLLGGTAIFTLLAYAQIRGELKKNPADTRRAGGNPANRATPARTRRRGRQ